MSLPRISVRNSVAVNLLMLLIIVVGLYYAFNLEREFFPDLDAEALGVTVVYPGAVPADIEKSASRGVKTCGSTAPRNAGTLQRRVKVGRGRRRKDPASRRQVSLPSGCSRADPR